MHCLLHCDAAVMYYRLVDFQYQNMVCLPRKKQNTQHICKNKYLMANIFFTVRVLIYPHCNIYRVNICTVIEYERAVISALARVSQLLLYANFCMLTVSVTNSVDVKNIFYHVGNRLDNTVTYCVASTINLSQ